MSTADRTEEDRADNNGSLWRRIGEIVSTHPVRVVAVTLPLLLLPALAVTALQQSHDTLAELPGEAEAVRGFRTLSEHFAPGELSPALLVVDDDQEVTSPGSLRALGDLSRNLKRLEGVATVRSVAMPTDGERPDTPESTAGLEQARNLDERLQQAADGAARLADGLRQVRDGLQQIDARLPELRAGTAEAADGVARLRDGIADARGGVDRLRSGAGELADGLTEARDGARRLRDDVAVPAEEAIRAAWDTLEQDFTVGRTDPAYPDALREVGEAYGRITGEDPRTGRQVDPAYDGLAPSLAELADGLSEARDGAVRLRDGLTELDSGLGRLGDGLAELQSGLEQARPGVDRLADGVDRLLDGTTQLLDGAERLRSELGQGAARLREADLASLLPGGDTDQPFVVTPSLLETLPEIRDELGLFLAEDGTRTRIFIGLAHDPFSPEALSTIEEIRDVADLSVQGSPLDDATVRTTGVSAFFTNIDAAVDADFPLIVGAVILGVFLVLVLLLRSLVAPAYMVLTVMLSFASALGATVLVFQGVLGHDGVAWWLPPFLFVLLVALGADYNIYLMGRVREEAETKPTRQAVADATRATGSVITSAGLILAGTFAALMFAELRSLVQMGFAVTLGILLDTFVVRSLLVPAVAALFGRTNWWPSARARVDETARPYSG